MREGTRFLTDYDANLSRGFFDEITGGQCLDHFLVWVFEHLRCETMLDKINLEHYDGAIRIMSDK